MIKLTEQQLAKVKDYTAINYHTECLVYLADITQNKRLINIMNAIKNIHYEEWYMPKWVAEYREYIAKEIEWYFSNLIY